MQCGTALARPGTHLENAMTDPKPDTQKDPQAPTGVNDDPPPHADDRPQHEDETLSGFLRTHDSESTSRGKDKPAK